MLWVSESICCVAQSHTAYLYIIYHRCVHLLCVYIIWANTSIGIGRTALPAMVNTHWIFCRVFFHSLFCIKLWLIRIKCRNYSIWANRMHNVCELAVFFSLQLLKMISMLCVHVDSVRNSCFVSREYLLPDLHAHFLRYFNYFYGNFRCRCYLTMHGKNATNSA